MPNKKKIRPGKGQANWQGSPPSPPKNSLDQSSQPSPPVFDRKGRIAFLKRLYNRVGKMDATFLTQQDLDALKINYQPLVITKDGRYAQRNSPRFFEPLSRKDLDNRPIDFDFDPKTRIRVQHEIDSMTEYFEKYSSPMRGAITLLYRMNWEFKVCPRRFLPSDQNVERGSEIGVLTPWLPGGFDDDMIDPSVRHSLFTQRAPNWTPDEVYKIDTDQTQLELPHTMFCIRHDVEGREEVLRGEVLSILAVIITRLGLPELSDHTIIPVLVFSFMGPQHGRMIQGFCQGNVFHLWMTELFDCTTSAKAEENVKIFLQHMANQPVGATKEKPTEPRRGLSLR